MSAVAELRARTAGAHAKVDRAFSAYDLGDRDDYRAFLMAHARALPVAECLIAQNPALPVSRARTSLLAKDMTALAQAMPLPLDFAGEGGGAAGWGLLYVVEGSRLGGGMLAGRVAAGLPTGYLGARHEPGEWRALGRAIDAEAIRHDAAWLDEVTVGANACFDLYRLASAR